MLTIRNSQTTEESWFSNTTMSDNLSHFLSFMGKRIELNGYQGYAAGLDTKSNVISFCSTRLPHFINKIILAGESGEFAYVSKWNDFDIMFHVAPLMPSQANDKQQVLRKRHIGNGTQVVRFYHL